MRVVLFIGHEGLGLGAVADGIDEHEWNHRLAASVAYRLARRGHIPFLVVGGANIGDAHVARAYEPSMVLSFHLNAYEGVDANGVEVLYFEDLSRPLAESLVRHIGCLGFRKRGAKERDDLFVLKALRGIPNVLIEPGFITNEHDRALLRRGDFLKEFGFAVCEAVSEWTVTHPAGGGA